MKFPSRYSQGKEVSPAQHIAELICEHKAQKDNVDLHHRFWLRKEWASYYRNQIGSANKLVEKYSARAVVKALHDPRAQRIYSLRAPHLIPIIDEYQKKIDAENTTQTSEIDRTDTKTFRKKEIKPDLLSKLKELDNGS
jgi:hypothetical protein